MHKTDESVRIRPDTLFLRGETYIYAVTRFTRLFTTITPRSRIRALWRILLLPSWLDVNDASDKFREVLKSM